MSDCRCPHCGGRANREAPATGSIGDDEEFISLADQFGLSTFALEKFAAYIDNRATTDSSSAAPSDLIAAVRFLLTASAPMTSQQKECWPSLQAAFDRAVAAAPSPTGESLSAVATVTKGSEFGRGLAFLANGKDKPKAGTILYALTPTVPGEPT